MTEYNTVQIGISPFWRLKYEGDAPKFWNAFYKRNRTNFYKDRHWLIDEATDGFPCLSSREGLTVVEAGCGVANAAFPLLRANLSMRIFAFDFAPSAIDIVRNAAAFDPARITAFQWDFAREDLSELPGDRRPQGWTEITADYALCLFVLSAVPPELHCDAIKRLSTLLRPGGQILFRDYCVSDLAASRFKQKSKISENYFVRQDGTLSYFFDEDRLESVMSAAGMTCLESRRIERTIVNRKERKEMKRVWIQAVYLKEVDAL